MYFPIKLLQLIKKSTLAFSLSQCYTIDLFLPQYISMEYLQSSSPEKSGYTAISDSHSELNEGY